MAGDIVTSRVFSNGETGITAFKMNDIIGSSMIQPAFVSAKPVASSTVAGDNLLLLTSGGTYAKIDSSTFSSSIAALLPAPEPKIWAVRLNSFNAYGNPNFEVDQRNVFASVTNATGFLCDRYNLGKTGTMTVNSSHGPSAVTLPGGSNFRICNHPLVLTLGTQQVTLGAGDLLYLSQIVEGSNFRELQDNPHSISLLVQSSVANLKFSVALRDSPSTKSLVKLCSLGAANTWTIIPLANLSVFPSGNFNGDAGNPGFVLSVVLACGTTAIAPAADTWQTGNYLGAPGMGNFAGSTVGATFSIAFIQHEPGSQCSTFMDKPFNQNYDECLRYFNKTYDYEIAPGTASNNIGVKSLIAPTAAVAYGPVQFPKSLAKVPTITIYNASTGAAGSVRDSNGVDHASATAVDPSKNGFRVLTFTTATTGAFGVYAHYTSDTGW